MSADVSIGARGVEELRESEARSRIVMETVADAVITVDEASRILAERIFGHATKL